MFFIHLVYSNGLSILLFKFESWGWGGRISHLFDFDMGIKIFSDDSCHISQTHEMYELI